MKIATKSGRAALAALVLLWPQLLMAWSENGHRIVGQIAQDLLTKDPGGANAIAGIKDVMGASYGPNALANIAPCADFVRHANEDGSAVPDAGGTINCGGLTIPVEPESAPWHFVDVPITESADSVGNFCGAKGCVISAISNAVSVLQTSAVQADRQKQLMYLVHFVGDAHQPLHCAYAVLSDGSPDRGGNCEHIRYGGKSMAFHALWDHRLNAADAPNWQAEAQRLEGGASVPTVTNAGAVALQAATESFQDGHDVMNEFLQLPNAAAQQCTRTPGQRIPSVVLPDGYEGQYAAKIDERLQMAGARLAGLLKLAFGGNGQAPRIISRAVAP